MAETVQFVPSDLVEGLRPDYPFGKMAWVLGSTPRDIEDLMKSSNLLPPDAPTLEEVMAQERTIVAVEAYLTRNCFLDCELCSVPKEVRYAKEHRKQLTTWKLMIDQLPGELPVKFIGGEVGGVPWLADIAGYAVNNGHAVSIFTDGVPFLDDQSRMEKVITATNGRVLWMTSVDFPTQEVELGRAAGKEEATARRFKAQRGLGFIDLVRKFGGSVIGHMMIHQGNKDLLNDVYKEIVVERGEMISYGTGQYKAHLFQGRQPEDYRSRLQPNDAENIRRQIKELVEIEDGNVKRGKRTIANSRAHLLTTHSVGITQDVGCSDPRIGPPGVFAIMPDGTIRGCPVVTTFNQIPECPGCAYAVFRDGDPRWADYLRDTGLYVPEAGKTDFPSLFYPTSENNFLTYAS